MKNGKAYKLLYVEDSMQLAELCIASLELHGYDVEIASNCAEATRLFSATTYDLALLDYNLPDGDGLTLAREFQNADSDIPIVLITAQGSEKVAAEALGLGISDYLIKSGREVYTEILPKVIGKTIRNAEAMVESKRLQNSIIESEKRFKDFAELGADRFWETDENFRFTYFSPPVRNLSLPSENFIGKIFWEVTAPENRPPSMNKIKELFEKHEEVRNISYNAVQAGTNCASLCVSAKPMFDDDGNFKGYRGTTRDETEELQFKDRAESVERQFFETLENSEMGLALWGPDERLVTFNSQYLKFNDFLAGFVEIGMTYEEFSSRRLEMKPRIESPMSDEKWLKDRIKKFRSPGSTREFKRGDKTFEMKTQRFDDGSTMMYLSDITDKKQYEDHRRQSLKMDAVGQLTGGIAHDFNNILAALHGNLCIIEDDPDNKEKLLVRLARAKKTVMRGADLTKRLLAFSRKQKLEPVSTNIHGLVSEILSLMKRSLGEDITIDLHATSDLWRAMVDVNQLENAILNLAINARDAIPKGGSVQIALFNYRHTAENNDDYDDLELGNYVAISVQDNGIGIPDDVLDKVFDPFFTTKEFGQGSGLGLSMVHGFINQTGGGVKIESKPEQGTKVTMLLPMSDQAAPEIVENPIKEIVCNGNGETIMVIEDDADVREIMVSALENSGYAVIDGGDGGKAITIANSSQVEIDLLLTDVMLPNGNRGPLLAREIEGEIKDLKVLLMTGYAQDNLLSLGEDGKGYPLIQKPFEIKELISTIQGLFHPN